MVVGYEMFVEYETLNKITKENNSEEFFEAMKKLYKGKGKKTKMCSRGRDVDVRFYKIGTPEKNNDVYVSDGFFYRGRLTSLIVYGDNQEEISRVQSRLEKETELELKKVLEGN